MKKEILIEVIGTQKIDSQKDKVELTTVGTIEEDENAFVVSYTEEHEPPLQSIGVVVRVYKDNSKVEMTRSGAYGTCLLIEKGQRNLCRYGTEYGDMLMGIHGKTIEAEFDGSEGSFAFGYDIDINGALASCNNVLMKFREITKE